MADVSEDEATQTEAQGKEPTDHPATEEGTEAGVGHPAAPARRMRRLLSIAAVILLFDVVTKVVAVATLEGREPLRLLGGSVYLVLYRNPGAAFSMATGMTWLLTIVATIVVIVVLRIGRNLRSAWWALGLGLVLGGALGNLIDRFFRYPGPMRGHVVDFVSVFAPDGSFWPVFNVADSSVVSGAILLVVLTFLGLDPDGTRHVSSRKKATEDATAGGQA